MYIKIVSPATLTKMTDNSNGTYTATYTISTVTTISISVYVLTPGLYGQYYSNTDFTGTPTTRVDSTISFDWGSGNIGPLSIVDASATWTGRLLAPYSELFTFTLGADDLYELFIDNATIISSLTGCCTYTSGTKQLTAGQFYDIVVKFKDTGFGAWIYLKWSSASVPLQVIPSTALSYWELVGSAASVSVQDCIATKPATSSTYMYQIGTAAYSYPVPITYTNSNCLSVETLTLSPTTASAWISMNTSTRIIQVSTSTYSLHDTSIAFTVTSTLSYSSAATSSYTFTITLNNPCLLTPPTASDYTYNIGTGPY